MEIKQLGAGEQTAPYVKAPEPGLMQVAGDAQNSADTGPPPAVRQRIHDNPLSANSALEFSIDKDTGRVVVRIIDRATQELVRQIPMEELLTLAKALGRLEGLLLDTKA